MWVFSGIKSIYGIEIAYKRRDFFTKNYKKNQIKRNANVFKELKKKIIQRRLKDYISI